MKALFLGWLFRETYFPFSTSFTWNRENKTPVVGVASANVIRASKEWIKAQLFGWSWVGVTLKKLRHLTSKSVKRSLIPKVEKKITYTKKKANTVSLVTLLMWQTRSLSLQGEHTTKCSLLGRATLLSLGKWSKICWSLYKEYAFLTLSTTQN